jgi:hypothetical protein
MPKINQSTEIGVSVRKAPKTTRKKTKKKA